MKTEWLRIDSLAPGLVRHIIEYEAEWRRIPSIVYAGAVWVLADDVKWAESIAN